MHPLQQFDPTRYPFDRYAAVWIITERRKYAVKVRDFTDWVTVLALTTACIDHYQSFYVWCLATIEDRTTVIRAHAGEAVWL